MAVPVFQVDAFTREPYRGNPAAVCLLSGPAPDDWMQAVAREMNLSETAFLHPERDGYRLRWFTPVTEVDLCGHATLASAHVLWEQGYHPTATSIRFYTRSGLLTVTPTAGLMEMDFPATPAESVTPPEGLTAALGLHPRTIRFVGRSRYDLLVEVTAPELVRNLEPDFARLARLEARGIIVTARDDTGAFDFISRFFAPRVGVPEDPVTGSSHCCLGPYWATLLGKRELHAYQASARGGELYIRVGPERVTIGGHAVTVLRGDLLHPPVGD